MIITDEKKLKDIQREFKQQFSHLKIVFYEAEHGHGEGSREHTALDPELTVGEVRSKKVEGDFEIKGSQPVGELEQALYDRYGLNAQVFRKSGNLWLQTTKTDSWTLNEQNRKGGASEQHFEEMHNDE
jgi:hypothetical protein